MSQHFLLSAAARTLSLAKVLRTSQTEAETVSARIRWEETEGRPVCPACGCLAMSRDLGVQHTTAFVLAHKIREAMGAEIKGAIVGGEGKSAEIDGAYFGGHVRPENKKADRKDRRLAENQTGKRRCVVSIRKRDGRTLTGVFPSEDAANSFIKTRIAKGTEVHADESPAWNSLHARYAIHRINHLEAYFLDGACTNEAASFFSRLRRAEIGHPVTTSARQRSLQ